MLARQPQLPDGDQDITAEVTGQRYLVQEKQRRETEAWWLHNNIRPQAASVTHLQLEELG